MNGVRIVVFAKAPVAGVAKTRLIPALGAEGAAVLARRMLAHALDAARRAAIGTVELCMSPSGDDRAWTAIELPAGVHRSSQGEGDLGARMARVVRRVTNEGGAVILMGTDCPGLSAARLRWVAYGLSRFDAVLVPTYDGGYAALGLRRYDPAVFAGIEWSTSSVAGETLARIARLNWGTLVGERVHDIDVPADLRFLPQRRAPQRRRRG